MKPARMQMKPARMQVKQARMQMKQARMQKPARMQVKLAIAGEPAAETAAFPSRASGHSVPGR